MLTGPWRKASALAGPAAGSPETGSPGRDSYEPGLVVDAVLRLLIGEHVAVAVGSLSQVTESARRLLGDLGVTPAPASSERAYWYGVADMINDRCRGADASCDTGGTAVADEAGEPR